MIRRNVETFLGCDADYEEAKVVLFGAPYDSTTSFRPGARFGPSAMRHESFGIENYSPYQDRELLDDTVFDSGDIELPFGAPRPALDMIRERAEEILKDGKLPLLVGGEHLVTLGNVEAVLKENPDLHILHFDAHCDLREDYLDNPLSHACVIRRCHDLMGDGRIHQFCIRSGDKAEWTFARAGHTDFHPFTTEGFKELAESLKESQTPVYVTIDLDCMDPSVFPGTGTPEAGGITFNELLKAILDMRGLNFKGADVNELAPMLDPTGVSTAVACKVLRELMLVLTE